MASYRILIDRQMDRQTDEPNYNCNFSTEKRSIWIQLDSLGTLLWSCFRWAAVIPASIQTLSTKRRINLDILSAILSPILVSTASPGTLPHSVLPSLMLPPGTAIKTILIQLTLGSKVFKVLFLKLKHYQVEIAKNLKTRRKRGINISLKGQNWHFSNFTAMWQTISTKTSIQWTPGS